MANTTARGYGTDHQRRRAAWAPRVATGQVDCHAVVCLEPSRRIQPGTPWDLGHTPDRTAYTGPEHRNCNRADGGRRGRAKQMAQVKPVRWAL